MNIVILGAGSIGSYLAMTLSQEEHNVIVIDKNPKALEKLSGIADIATHLGSGTNYNLLDELSTPRPDLFIAVSSDDETNLVACAIAKSLGYPRTLARVRETYFLDRSRVDFSRLFSVDHFIGTELILAHDIFKCIINPGNIAIENFAHGVVQMRTLIIPEKFHHAKQKISQLSLPSNLLIGLIRQKDKILFPKGGDVILPGDEVTVIGEAKAMRDLHKYFDVPYKPIKSVVIAGGSRAAMHVAKLLEEQKINVKILEPDEERCQMLAKTLPYSSILNVDGTDLSVLQAMRVDKADTFVACTGATETNILTAELAKEAGCKEVIAVVSDASYAPLLRRLGIYYTVSERVSIAARIHCLLQIGAIISVSSLYENRVKILEIKVSEDSEIVGYPIKDLSSYFPQEFLIALIENRGRLTVAHGGHILAPGDTAIVLCSPKHIQEIGKLF